MSVDSIPGMSLTVFDTLEQGSEEWLYQRCGIITASVVGQLITPKTVKPASNDYSRGLTMHLAAERATGFVEPVFSSAAVERGTLDEPYAREMYDTHHAPVTEVGFMVRQFDNFRIGYSPDGLVGDDGLIEIKSRNQKIQLKTILNNEVPLENMAQIQCGLLVSGRDWLDYVSYSGGMPLFVKRVLPDLAWHTAIIDAVTVFEATVTNYLDMYEQAAQGLPLAERINHYEEMRF